MQRNRSEGMDISAFFGVIRRRLWIIAITVVVAAGVAYVISNGQENKYSASATLFLQGGSTSSQTAPTFDAPVPVSVIR